VRSSLLSPLSWSNICPVVKQISAYDASEIDIPIGDRLNLCYSSTVVTKGRGVGVVIGTGMNTQVGHISLMLLELSHLFQIGHIAAAISGGPQKAHEDENLPFHKRFYERFMATVYVSPTFIGRHSLFAVVFVPVHLFRSNSTSSHLSVLGQPSSWPSSSFRFPNGKSRTKLRSTPSLSVSPSSQNLSSPFLHSAWPSVPVEWPRNTSLFANWMPLRTWEGLRISAVTRLAR